MKLFDAKIFGTFSGVPANPEPGTAPECMPVEEGWEQEITPAWNCFLKTTACKRETLILLYFKYTFSK